MIYSELVRTAMIIACKAHEGEVDKGGYPYIHHVMHVAEYMPDEKTVCAALLHDVVENTPITCEILRGAGIPQEVLHALSLLTHDPDTPYLDYISQLMGDPIARAVKLADLRHNSDPSRLPCADAQAQERLQKYQQALRLLESNGGNGEDPSHI